MAYSKNEKSREIPKENFYATSKGYVYFQNGKSCYCREKKQARPKPVAVGKLDRDNKEMFIPNGNYYRLFPPKTELPETPSQSSSLSFGPYCLLGKIIGDCSLFDCLANSFALDRDPAEKDYEYADLLLDLASYMIREESCDIQHYPAYCFHSAIRSDKIHGDATIGTLFKEEVTRDVRDRFLLLWSEKQKAENRDETVYICYDSTNFNSTSEGITFVEKGYAKDLKEEPQFNLECIVRSKDGMPLLYDVYPGSIVDIRKCRSMIERVKAMGYKKITFVCDRGYISEENIREILSEGYGFIMMVKDNLICKKSIVSEHGAEVKNMMDKYIPSCDLFGDTFEDTIYKNINVYRHLFYSHDPSKADRSNLYSHVSELEEELNEILSRQNPIGTTKEFFLSHYGKYFDLEFHEEQGKKLILKSFSKNQQKIKDEYGKIGFWTIVSSERMTCEEVLEQCRLRDRSEKMFMYIKTNFRMKKLCTHSNETTDSKIFVAFIASIIRSVLVDRTRMLREKYSDSKSYTVKASLDELSKIEGYRKSGSKNYLLSYQLTKKQTRILEPFGLNTDEIKKMIEAYKSA